MEKLHLLKKKKKEKKKALARCHVLRPWGVLEEQGENETSGRGARAGFAALTPMHEEMHWSIYQKLQVSKL